MPFLILALMMQYVVSVKAGLVNHVEGTANVAEMDMARVGRPIRTADDGYIEMLLTPGSFLRIGEDSEFILDSVELTNVSLRLIKGPAVIEVVEISDRTPIKVTTGNLTTTIKESGIFRFVDGTATVIRGKLHTADTKLAYEKGWQLFYQNNYRARKLSEVQPTSLDFYSEIRSQKIAQANNTLVSQLPSTYSYTYDSWLYAPYIGMFTFIPRGNFTSHYGHRYYAAGSGRTVRYSNTGSSSGFPSGPTTGGSTTSNNNNNNNSGGDSGGAPPPITVATPAGERTAPAVYIEGKNSSRGATQ